MNPLDITIISPGGNTTALVRGIPPVLDRKRINDDILKKYPTVEQVGFYTDTPTPRLQMAGGEFCGNATRSLAYLLLKGKPGEIILRVSGANTPLVSGVIQPYSSWTRIPIMRDLGSIKRTKTQTVVSLQGITHILRPCENFPKNEPLAKKEALSLLSSEQLLTTQPASGVIYVKKRNNRIYIYPVVWVRDIQTLFCETACGSGSVAVALVEAFTQRKSVSLAIGQPSGKVLTASVMYTNAQFVSATLAGPIRILQTGIYVPKERV